MAQEIFAVILPLFYGKLYNVVLEHKKDIAYTENGR
jgi:hypothetical protein